MVYILYMYIHHLFTGMCATPERTLISHWASWSTLKRSNPLCSPRRPSCWDWGRLTNRYSTPWLVCTLASHTYIMRHTWKHFGVKHNNVLSTLLWWCCRAARGRSGLSNAGSVHATHQTPPKGKNITPHGGFPLLQKKNAHLVHERTLWNVCLGFRWRNTSLQRSLPTGRKLGMRWASFTQPADHWCDPPTKRVRNTLAVWTCTRCG